MKGRDKISKCTSSRSEIDDDMWTGEWIGNCMNWRCSGAFYVGFRISRVNGQSEMIVHKYVIPAECRRWVTLRGQQQANALSCPLSHLGMQFATDSRVNEKKKCKFVLIELREEKKKTAKFHDDDRKTADITAFFCDVTQKWFITWWCSNHVTHFVYFSKQSSISEWFVVHPFDCTHLAYGTHSNATVFFSFFTSKLRNDCMDKKRTNV